MRVDKGSSVNAVRMGDTPTVAELFDSLAKVTTEPGTAKEKLGKVTALYDKAKAMGVDGPYRLGLAQAALAAVRTIGGAQAANHAFVRRLSEAIRTQAAASRPPVFEKNVPFEMGGDYSTSRATVAASAAMMTYAPVLQSHDALSKQGFSDVVTTRTSASAQSMTAARADVGLVAFAGTADMADFVADAASCLKPNALVHNGKLHDGFTKQLDSIWPDIKAQIQHMREVDPNRPILFTGHSLGGALAVLAAARAKKEGLLDHPPTTNGQPAALLHTFGQPKVGDAAAATSLEQQLAGIPYTREVFRGDPVTQIPPDGMGFSHIASATVVFHDGMGKTTVGGAALIPPLPQQLDPASLMKLAAQMQVRVPDHNEVNYAVTAFRNWEP